MAYSFRSSISILIIAIFFVIVFFKLLFLQIVEGDKYKRISQNNFLREAIIPSPRGTIYDRNGVKISYSRPMVNLYIKNSSKEKGLQLISKLKNNNINLNKIDLDNIFDKNNNSFLRQRILIKKDLSIEDIYIIDTKFSSYENILESVLSGCGRKVHMDVVALNTSLVLWAAGIEADIEKGFEKALFSMSKAKPWDKFLNLKAYLET